MAKKSPLKSKTKPLAAKTFVTAAKRATTLATHAEMMPVIIKQLRGHGIKASQKLPLEFFFATNAAAKAKALVEMLEVHEYAVVMVRDGAKFLVTGLTPSIPMSKRALSDWSSDMTSLGFEFDALFDGWGLAQLAPLGQ